MNGRTPGLPSILHTVGSLISGELLSATKLLLPLSAMAETTSNRGGLTAPPNSPTQGATTPPSCDEIQSCSLMDPIPTTRMRERLEDEPPQSSSSSRAPSPCQPVTLGSNSIALSRANYGCREDDEIIHASATPSLKDNASPNNSPPLNHLLIRLNQNALLVCGLFNHSRPSNPFAHWDVQYLNQYGVEVYTGYLLALTELSTSKQRKRYESNAQWLELRLRDLQAHLQLRDYAVLEAEFSDRQTPEGMTTRAMLCQLQRFQEAALSDFAHWPSEGYDDAVAISLTKCLARLRFTASLAALQADPARVMATIYWKFERTLHSDGLPSTLPSPCITDQADFSEEYHCKSWLADVSDDSDDDSIGWWSA
ncbi:Zinc finger protein [Fusarium oxysporum f. sp. albedinis]|nr:Zinc finger protein [Fusarium oxysporum f. sp. albedinis]